MEVIDDTTQLKTDDQIEAETKEFEFLVPLHSLVKLRPFVDRYFIKYYKTFPSESDPAATTNQYAFCHTNKLFMIGIANEHEIVTKKMKIKQISFDKLDKEAGLAVKGKKKSIGGLKVKTGEKIAQIVTEDGKVFPLFSLVDGNVIEINEAIEKDPNIILTEAEAKGYIAIINSGLKIERYVSKLTPEQEYRALVDKKEKQTTEPMVEEKPSK